mmetsp:Transcript_20485/g.72437  ORF Transcript_20485/g.72437 Transcript_20485/m.72437 type:complete len:202 (-) Transcript_20485:65-670(-)
MVVLEHRHGRQVHAVRRSAAHQQRILLHLPESRRRLARARHAAMPACRPRDVDGASRLRRNAAGAGQDVQRCPLRQQDAASRARDHGSDQRRSRCSCRAQQLALAHAPLDVEAELAEDGVGEGHAREHRLRLHQQVCTAMDVPYDKAACVERGRVILKPAAHQALQRQRRQRRSRRLDDIGDAAHARIRLAARPARTARCS